MAMELSGFFISWVSSAEYFPIIASALVCTSSFISNSRSETSRRISMPKTTSPVLSLIGKVELSTFPIKDSTGEVVFGIEILRDVSERELLMNELVQTRALAIMGKYSAELTHEIKNPLNSIAIQI